MEDTIMTLPERTPTAPEVPDDLWTIGDRIRKTRRLMAMEQKEFGALFGRSDKAVSHWENDKGLPQRLLEFARTLELIAQERGLDWVTEGWILTGDYHYRQRLSLSVISGEGNDSPGTQPQLPFPPALVVVHSSDDRA